MGNSQAILDQWILRTIESYPVQMQSHLRTEQDPFRNPVGHALRENLGVLVRELLGDMESSAIALALDSIIRIRAVQDFAPADALRFIFDLRPIVREVSGPLSDEAQGRIDSLALTAFEQYMQCREQIFTLRVKEIRSHAQYAAQ